VIRGVLDANVFVSALLRPSGPPGQIVEHLFRERAFDLIISPPILEEVGRVLAYSRVRRYLGLTRVGVDRWVASLADIGLLVPGEGDTRAVQRDPDDDRYIVAAIEGGATHIVSGDRHLLDLGAYQDIPIISPRAFLEILTR
jgi:putative PIN family toxin of toxin-antitoxin system